MDQTPHESSLNQPVSPIPASWGEPLPPPQKRGFTLLAWFFILLGCAAAVSINSLDLRSSQPTVEPEEDRLGVMLMEMQAKYMVSASEVESSSMIYAAAEKALNQGSIPQRQRFVILAAELMSKEEAATKLAELDELIAKQEKTHPDDAPLMTPAQSHIQLALREIYRSEQTESQDDLPAEVPDAPANEGHRVDTPAAVDQDAFIKEMGWFGKLALTHWNPDDTAARDEVMRPARTIMYLLVAGSVIAVVVGILGFVGLVVIFIFAALKKVQSGMRSSPIHHGIYAETFAIWLFLFFVLNAAAGVVGTIVPDFAMLLVFFGFFSSLIALVWPVLRGASWRQVRQDIGLTFGRVPLLEPLAGVAGYAMALPILAIGLGMTIVFLKIQETFRPDGPIFGPSGGPAHPIIEQLGGPDWWPKIMVLMLAAIAAPVVEEIMFRGVLYRHLRSAISAGGMIGSIILGALINSFVFAIIHPQGWVAVPALMSLATAFTLMREWRGSVIPAMIMHGISNFIVMSFVIMALRA